eukprot:scaffold25563_cov65-Phaeocystis_antarctica.AAC.1
MMLGRGAGRVGSAPAACLRARPAVPAPAARAPESFGCSGATWFMCVTEKPCLYGFSAASATAVSATSAAGVAATIERADATRSEILACPKAGVAGGRLEGARDPLPVPLSTPVDAAPACESSACCSAG